MILIVGASGYVGNKLFWHLRRKGFNIKGTYYTNSSNLPKKEKLFLDLNKDKFNGLLKMAGLTHVILCHGISGIEQCKKEPDLSYRINVLNTIKLLKYVKILNAIPIYFSTDMVYSGRIKSPSESTRPNPSTEYGRQKLLIEKYIKKTFDKYIVLRPTKIFGIERNDKTIFTLWLDKLLKGKIIIGAHDSFISPVYIMDILNAVEILIRKNQYGVFNLGGYGVLSIYELAIQMANFFHYDEVCIRKLSISDFNFIEKRPRYNSVDSAKIEKILSRDRQLVYEYYFSLIAKKYNKFS